MSLRRAQEDELSKLRILEFLSNPRRAGAGFFGERSGGATKEDIKFAGGFYRLGRILPEMQKAALIARDETSKAAKPYFITDEGRRYLAEAKQRAMVLAPGDREGWADAVGGESHKIIARFLQRLPEFEGSGEARIQQVSRDLAEAIGLPAPETARTGPERSGR